MMGGMPANERFTITFTREELESIVDTIQWVDEYWGPTLPPDALRLRLEALLTERTDGA